MRMPLSRSSQNISRLGLAFAFALFSFSMIRVAWLSDDGMITWRTVNNLVNGFGPVWNIYERVQSYTHPLWMMALAAANFFTREFRLTTYALSFLASLGAVFVFTRGVTVSPRSAIIGLVIFAGSKAFAEFSTSGLENPLVHLLLALFFALGLRQSQPTPRALFWMSVCAGLLAMTRMDALVLIAPLLFLWVVRALVLSPRNTPRVLAVVLAGFAPFIIWEIFSVVYYGFPFPNTYYAKLNTGISLREYAKQSLYYFENSLLRDPLTLAVMDLAVPIALNKTRRSQHLAMLVGITGYLLYVISIGGDFMSGRFFSAPLFCAVCLICNTLSFHNVRFLAMSLVVVLLSSLVMPLSPLRSDRSYSLQTLQENHIGSIKGVGDERSVYFQGFNYQDRQWDAGFLIDLSAHPSPPPSIIDVSLPPSKIVIEGAVGWLGIISSQDTYILDTLALNDPLLARLPVRSDLPWRIGHFYREPPIGYVESLQLGGNRIQQPRIAKLYDDLRLVTRGDLFTANRWQAIYRLNTGEYADLMKRR